MKLAALVLAAVLWAASASAQTCEANCEITQAQPFTVFTELDLSVVSYAVLVDGARSSLNWRFSSGFVEFLFSTGLSRGTYSFAIVAYDGNGAEVWRSDPNTLTVKPGKRTTRFRV